MSNSEQSLTIKDLFYIILSAWRQIILFSVVGALLMTGFLFLRSWRSSSLDIDESEVSLTSKEIQVATEELLESDLLLANLKKNKSNLTNQAIALQDRIRNSVYLSIDGNAQPLIRLTVTVNPEEPGPDAEDTWEQRRYALILDFFRIAKGDALRQYLVDANHSLISTTWMGELTDSQLLEESVLQFTVTAPDSETVTLLAEAASSYFQRDIRGKISVLYLYDIQVSAEPLRIIRNPQLTEERRRLADDLETIQLAIQDTQDEIDMALEEALEEVRLQKVDRLISESEGQGGISKGALVKYALVGILAGIMLALMVAVYRATSKDVIRSGEWLASHQGLFYLGSLPAGDEKSGKSSGRGALDRWLERRFYSKHGQSIPAPERMQYLSSVIHGLWRSLPASSESKEDGGPTIAFVSEEGISATDAFLSFMNSQAEVTGPGKPASLRAVKVTTQTREGIELLGKSQAAVVIIRTRQTRQAQVLRDLTLIDRMGIPVLGLIAIEGDLT